MGSPDRSDSLRGSHLSLVLGPCSCYLYVGRPMIKPSGAPTRVRGEGTSRIPKDSCISLAVRHSETDEPGIVVRARLRWLTRRIAAIGDTIFSVPEFVWSHTWEELGSALVAPRKVVLIPHEGRRVRFVTVRRRQLRPLVEALRNDGMPTEKISRLSRAGFSV